MVSGNFYFYLRYTKKVINITIPGRDFLIYFIKKKKKCLMYIIFKYNIYNLPVL